MGSGLTREKWCGCWSRKLPWRWCCNVLFSSMLPMFITSTVARDPITWTGERRGRRSRSDAQKTGMSSRKERSRNNADAYSDLFFRQDVAPEIVFSRPREQGVESGRMVRPL